MEVDGDKDMDGQVKDIAPNGDVILIVGTGKKRLRVQSHCLRSASKVFDSMFGPNWLEGSALSSGSPKEVALEDDDADAMRIICAIVHHRNDMVPQDISPLLILYIATLADKYDLRTALRFASVAWLKTRVEAEQLDLARLMAAAFLFKDNNAFMTHALTLTIHHGGSYLYITRDATLSQVLPPGISLLLEERRTKLRAELSQKLIVGQNEKCNCGWGANRSQVYRQITYRYGPLSMMLFPVVTVMFEMEAVSTHDMVHERYCDMILDKHVPPPANELKILRSAACISIDDARGTFPVDEP